MRRAILLWRPGAVGTVRANESVAQLEKSNLDASVLELVTVHVLV